VLQRSSVSKTQIDNGQSSCEPFGDEEGVGASVTTCSCEATRSEKNSTKAMDDFKNKDFIIDVGLDFICYNVTSALVPSTGVCNIIFGLYSTRTGGGSVCVSCGCRFAKQPVRERYRDLKIGVVSLPYQTTIIAS